METLVASLGDHDSERLVKSLFWLVHTPSISYFASKLGLCAVSRMCTCVLGVHGSVLNSRERSRVAFLASRSKVCCPIALMASVLSLV